MRVNLFASISSDVSSSGMHIGGSLIQREIPLLISPSLLSSTFEPLASCSLRYRLGVVRRN